MDGGRERRVHKRVPVNLTGELEYDGTLRQAIILDLSMGGAQMQCAGFEWPAPGTPMMLCLSLGARKISLLSKVARLNTQDHRAGLCFEPMGNACETLLARLVYTQDVKHMKAHLHLLD